MNREEIFHDLMETIYELSRKIHSYESIPRKYGTEDELYMVEAHTINLIGDHSQTTTSELANLTHKTKGAISQMIDKLIKKDLVTKFKNPNDNREIIIELTKKGEKVYEFHKELDKKEYSFLLDNLTEFSTKDFIKFKEISSTLSKFVK